MPIDFHAEQNRNSYTSRNVHDSWTNMVNRHTTVKGSRVADIGCGGGIYTKKLAEMDAAEAVGVDYSAKMLEAARESCGGYRHVRFEPGDANGTSLASGYYDLVIERALIHHLTDLRPCFAEAYRVIRHGGMLLVQDRTPEDCLLPGGEEHIRGIFFEMFPQLAAIETARRHASGDVIRAMEEAGFASFREDKLWEIRKTYETFEQLAEELKSRRGRSILHELSDGNLKELIERLRSIVPEGPLVEKDRWTVWIAVKT